MLGRISSDKAARERFQILAPLTQRRHLDVNHVEPIEQIIAKSSPLNCVFEIGIGRSDQPRVDLNRLVPAQPFELAVLDHPQEFRLRIERKMRNLVEYQSPAMRGFQSSRLRFSRAAECTALVTEQLGF